MISRTRTTVAIAAVAVSALLTTSCASQGGGEGDGDGSTFVYLSDLAPVCFDTAAYRNLANYNVVRQITDPLVRQSVDGSYSPGLADEWSVSDDGLKWTFHIREGITFHDGTTLDAHDVKASADRFSAEDTSLLLVEWLAGSSRVVDDYTWEVTLKEPMANLLQQASTPDFPILSSESIEEFSDADRCADPTTLVGTGPFIATEYKSGESLILERNEDYQWAPEFANHTGPAYMERVEMRFIPETQSRIGNMQAGQADAAAAIPPLNAEELEQSAGLDSVSAPSTGVPFTAILNSTDGPTADFLVRDALFYAADLDGIVENLYAGRYERAWSTLTPTTAPAGSYNEELENSYKYDQAHASELLAQAGYTKKNDDGILVDSSGTPLQLRWIFDSADIRDQRDLLAEAIQADVRKIGIDIKIEKLDTAGYLDRIDNADFEILAESWGQSDAYIMLVVIGPYAKYPGYEDPEATQWMFDAWRTVDDDAKRVSLYHKIQERLSEKRITLPIYVQEYTVVTKPEISGIMFDPVGFPTSFYDVTRNATN